MIRLLYWFSDVCDRWTIREKEATFYHLKQNSILARESGDHEARIRAEQTAIRLPLAES